MYEDAKRELKRLEKALLEEEQPLEDTPEDPQEYLSEDLLPEEYFLEETQKVPSNGRAYNTDRTDWDLETYAEDVYSGGRKGLSGLIAAVILLAGAIVAVLLFWLIRYGGVLLCMHP